MAEICEGRVDGAKGTFQVVGCVKRPRRKGRHWLIQTESHPTGREPWPGRAHDDGDTCIPIRCAPSSEMKSQCPLSVLLLTITRSSGHTNITTTPKTLRLVTSDDSAIDR